MCASGGGRRPRGDGVLFCARWAGTGLLSQRGLVASSLLGTLLLFAL